MRSIVYHSFGQSEEVMKPEDRPRPEPQPGQTLAQAEIHSAAARKVFRHTEPPQGTALRFPAKPK